MHLIEYFPTFALVCIFSRICFSMRPTDRRAPDEARRIVATTISVLDIYLQKFIRGRIINLSFSNYPYVIWIIKFTLYILNTN